jgi:hypothetical protein
MDMTESDITIRETAPGESAIILHHRRSMFRDMGEGTVEELDQMVEVQVRGWHGLWLMVPIITGWRWTLRAVSRAAAVCCSVRGRRIPKIHALSGR